MAISIAIVTATYNRCKLLVRLYESLKKQTFHNFTWIVIDDGSTDNTGKFISSVCDDCISIKYARIKNGGKCKALNYAFKHFSNYTLYAVVDSDDYLIPSAVETILLTATSYKDNRHIGGVFFRYLDSKTNQVITGKREYSYENVITSRIQHDVLYGKYDGCITYFNKAISKYRYPEFSNEKYMGPIVIQLIMDNEFDFVFTKHIIGIAEYQKNGLTKGGRQLRLKSPLSMIVYCGLMQQSKKIFMKFKYATMAYAYLYYGNIPFSKLKTYNIPYHYFPLYAALGGYILSLFWKCKYGKQN